MNERKIKGLITKSIGGLYTVESPEGLFICKPKGKFRKLGQSPLVGDAVTAEVYGENEGVISEISPRKNELVRPPLANLDVLIIVVSTCSPVPNFTVIDKLIAIAEYKGIEPVLVITKTDLSDGGELLRIYTHAGFKVFCCDNTKGEVPDGLMPLVAGKICGFAGNTGVGKSSFLNVIDSSLLLKTGEISEKLGRGRHTTRHAQLYKLSNGAYIADTPGFSSLETDRYEIILKDRLQDCFREFSEYKDKCRFTNCSHTKEKGCAVIEALNCGEIEKSRFESYVKMYEEAKKIKEWEV